MRPYFLLVMPPVDVAAAILPLASQATAPTVPNFFPPLILPCSDQYDPSGTHPNHELVSIDHNGIAKKVILRLKLYALL